MVTEEDWNWLYCGGKVILLFVYLMQYLILYLIFDTQLFVVNVTERLSENVFKNMHVDCFCVCLSKTNEIKL